ncbi:MULTISPECIES: CNP1-like family protein [Ramlibacter]|uniref:CNP1-like family protein n=1 Tax=Ramlibacter TaxID=174951 RepID=UPI0012F7CC4E|nr:CNP1-like family protein [Ramlibacter sp. CGMCC 1.13660]
MRRELRGPALVLALSASLAHAQLVPVDPDWKELTAPAPPASLRTQGLVPIDVEPSQLRWGIDPDSIAVGADGIVRYVVVARGEGSALNAFYEGLRCSSGEVKVYARRSSDGGWVPAAASDWQTVFNNPPVRHSLVIARNGACTGKVANVSAAQIQRDLASASKGRHLNDSR